jgi:hypothetical protein
MKTGIRDLIRTRNPAADADSAEAARFMNDLVAKLEDANFLGRQAEGKEEN